jgi:hypothetical protein
MPALPLGPTDCRRYWKDSCLRISLRLNESCTAAFFGEGDDGLSISSPSSIAVECFLEGFLGFQILGTASLAPSSEYDLTRVAARQDAAARLTTEAGVSIAFQIVVFSVSKSLEFSKKRVETASCSKHQQALDCTRKDLSADAVPLAYFHISRAVVSSTPDPAPVTTFPSALYIDARRPV